MIALDGERGHRLRPLDPRRSTCSRGLDACAEHLLRHGGHRAAAGCTVAASEVDALRAAFVAHAAAVAGPRRPRARAADRRGRLRRGHGHRARRGARAARAVRHGQPAPGAARCPAARMSDVRTMGEGKHVRFTVERRRRPRERRRVRARRGCPTATRTASTRRSASRSTAGTARRSRGSSCAPPRRRAGADRPPGRRWRAARRSPTALARARRAARRVRARRRRPPGAVRDRRGCGHRGDAHGARRDAASRCSSSWRARSAARGSLRGPARRLRPLLVGRAGARARSAPMTAPHVVALDPPMLRGARACAAARRRGPHDPPGLGRP